MHQAPIPGVSPALAEVLVVMAIAAGICLVLGGVCDLAAWAGYGPHARDRV